VHAKKPFHNTHEINFAAFVQETTEESLNIEILRKIDKVVKLKPQREQGSHGHASVGTSG
jgi:hypothetical protein